MRRLAHLLTQEPHVCPWWLAYTFDNPFRRLLHQPEQMFAKRLQAGMTAVDLGCGMGYFSIAMARMVGDSGRVMAVDIQPQMLKVLEKRALQAGVRHRIQTHCSTDGGGIGLGRHVADVALAFWMVHEVLGKDAFVREIFDLLRPGGVFLVAEPRIHVPPELFDRILALGQESGFQIMESPRITASYAAWLKKPE
jgi:ubiquinone/menaquinone biosynthesis C-methylase UbiE